MERLESLGGVDYLPDFCEADLEGGIDAEQYEIIFTNPNKTNVYLGGKILVNFTNLRTIVTASTGTVHIDKEYCESRGLGVISITTEYTTLKQITSTAELALTGTLAACRNYIDSVVDARQSANWDYERYIGRQIFGKNVGVLGYGRLGSMYANYMTSLGAKVHVHEQTDVQLPDSLIPCGSVTDLFRNCEIVSLHVHATQENLKLVNSALLNVAPNNLILVNTSRGEIVDEGAICSFLNSNPEARYVADVISNETGPSRLDSPLYTELEHPKQLLLSQHIGGMTADAQRIAYNRAIDLLENHLSRRY
jgi:D-3-phosphoglycerate dehydrogenase